MADGGVRVAAVVVTYQPRQDALTALLTAVAPQVADVVVVDNGSSAPWLEERVATHGGALLRLGANLGIAAAQNRGCDAVRAAGATHVLLLDQDSVPAPDMVQVLVAATAAAHARGDGRVAAVGATGRDDRDGEPPFVYAARRWGPRRIDLPDVPGTLVEVGFLIASGTLVDVAALDAVGPMDEGMFIDHVDLEWGVRARRAGWHLYAVVGAELRHELGETPRAVPGRSRTVHVQSVVRNYYMTRNTIRLVRTRNLMPAAWRWGYLWWITKYVVYYTLAVAPRRVRVPLMLRGLRDGVLGRSGPLPGR
ncbi:glycosyltransferase family 2 protein [Cellulomonas dongxiuzhuiae]|uniref:glycosyltransferase family 2 protein n=1 Tax=Cellulomonas dongxiuzhuiae TaxID=2819979 RepID=UPI001AAF8BEF|nr:glycosyltransferase family 2 protein [Cellulomonas dongxiuzhuiae]MBO3086705.1 glycosyltransferase family 2 protein [Cellulomonas dongxiuzhuiae]